LAAVGKTKFFPNADGLAVGVTDCSVRLRASFLRYGVSLRHNGNALEELR